MKTSKKAAKCSKMAEIDDENVENRKVLLRNALNITNRKNRR